MSRILVLVASVLLLGFSTFGPLVFGTFSHVRYSYYSLHYRFCFPDLPLSKEMFPVVLSCLEACIKVMASEPVVYRHTSHIGHVKAHIYHIKSLCGPRGIHHRNFTWKKHQTCPRHLNAEPEKVFLDPKNMPKTPFTSGGMTGCLGMVLVQFSFM